MEKSHFQKVFKAAVLLQYQWVHINELLLTIRPNLIWNLSIRPISLRFCDVSNHENVAAFFKSIPQDGIGMKLEIRLTKNQKRDHKVLIQTSNFGSIELLMGKPPIEENAQPTAAASPPLVR